MDRRNRKTEGRGLEVGGEVSEVSKASSNGVVGRGLLWSWGSHYGHSLQSQFGS